MNMIFMGRKKYAADLLQWTAEQGIDVCAVVTDDHLPDSPTAHIARRLQIPVISMEEAETFVQREDTEVDLVVSYLFWRKIRAPLINRPALGCINFHPAILPDWRGTAGYNIAILHKLSEWGATAHFVDETIDTGRIIRVFKFHFDYRLETAFTLEKKTQEIQVSLYKSIILDILEGKKLEAQPQPSGSGLYISRKEMETLKFIDAENDDIDLKIRAFWFPPYDGASIELQGKRYTLVNREILKALADNTANRF